MADQNQTGNSPDPDRTDTPADPREARVHEARVHEARVHEAWVHEARVHEARVHEAWIRDAVREHGSPLLRYAVRLLAPRRTESARDVVQDTFVKLCRADRAEIEDHLAEWLYTVCRNRAFDILRKEERMNPISSIHPPDAGPAERIFDGTNKLPIRNTADPSDDSPDERAAKPETTSSVLRALDNLPTNQKDVLRLKFQAGLSYKEIARATNLSVSNVGFLIHTALKSLRDQFTNSTSPSPQPTPQPVINEPN